MARLAGKIALITGGTTGIGRECARLFRDEGATVIVTGTNPANVAAVKNELGVEALVSNAADLTAIDTLVAHIEGTHGKLDVLVANAGIGGQRPLEAMDPAYYDNIMNLNVRGLYFLVQKALPLLGSGASIVLTASVAAHAGVPTMSVYGASKAAVRSLGRSFAAELSSRGIRVNTLSPGPIDTPIMDKAEMPRAVATEMFTKMVPMGRIGTSLEAAYAALFLASDESSYITASEILVAGGMADV